MEKFSVTLFCDGDSVLRKLRQPIEDQSKYMLQNDIDVVLELKTRIQMFPENIKVRYVPGHQDKNKQFEDLPLTQQLNVLMDDQVRIFIDDVKNRPGRNFNFPIFGNTKAWIENEGSLLSHDIEQVMCRNYYGNAWETYSADKFNFTPEINRMIDRKNIGHVLQRTKQGKSQSVKLLHDVQFTSLMRQRWGLSSDTTCPLCHISNDTKSHYFFCSHKLLHERQNKLRNELMKHLIKADTDAMLQKTVLRLFAMDECNGIEDFPHFSSLPQDLKIAVCEQIDIGVELFKLGIISNKFGAYQAKMVKVTS